MRNGKIHGSRKRCGGNEEVGCAVAEVPVPEALARMWVIADALVYDPAKPEALGQMAPMWEGQALGRPCPRCSRTTLFPELLGLEPRVAQLNPI